MGVGIEMGRSRTETPLGDWEWAKFRFVLVRLWLLAWVLTMALAPVLAGSTAWIGLDPVLCAAFWAELEPHKFRSSSLPLCGIVYADNYDGATIELSVSRVGYGGTGLGNDEGESLGGRDGGGTRTECNS